MRRIWCGLTCGLIVLTLLELRGAPATAQNTGPTIVWLVRHADRADHSPDSPLKDPQGFQRADDLTTLLSKKGITAIITTDKTRTKQTAKPLADEEKIVPVVVPLVETNKGVKQNIEAVVTKVTTTQGKVLVVGHSNTLPGIIGKLGGPKSVKICNYDRLFSIDRTKQPFVFQTAQYGQMSPGCPPLPKQ